MATSNNKKGCLFSFFINSLWVLALYFLWSHYSQATPEPLFSLHSIHSSHQQKNTGPDIREPLGHCVLTEDIS